MTQENKELLIKDLCARLPYGVRCDINGEVDILDSICDDDGYYFNFIGENKEGYTLDEVKPYLFPLSSMTWEQKEELFKLCEFCIQEDWEGKKSEVYAIEIASRFDPAYCYNHDFNLWGVDMRAIDWLIKNHFDYRGLIEKGLSIDATNLNIY